MQPVSVTIGIPVQDLAISRAWYDRVLAKPADIEPVPGIAEYRVASVWVQLALAEGAASGGSWVLRIGVSDLHAERERLAGLGIEMGETVTVPGVISFFSFRDPDGNRISWYQEL